jgi:hypothetical protein
MAKSQIRQYVFTPGAAGAGTIEIPGKYDLQQFLVITNSTKNVIIYNFADPTFSGTTVNFFRANDLNYPTTLDNTDGYTLITLAANTSAMSSSDTLQILFEQPFQYVRSPEIGTDAFERQRVAAPQSLLDADFEYGMQPTKWLTLSMLRGYPAIYEIPGTDLTVTAATSDASSGAGGFATAESAITITTASAHGYQVGQAFTIRGFNSAFTGFDRAEGSFVVYSVPASPTVNGSPSTFTYIAKGKVGFNNNDNIWTSVIQLRQGGFYSGSNINAVINTTATATTASTANYITLSSTAGIFQGCPIIFNTVTTNCIATNATTGYVTIGTTVGMVTNMPLYLSGTSFGGLTSGQTYYVTGIIDTRTITLSLAVGGTTPSTLVTALGGNMYVVGGSQNGIGGILPGVQYYISTPPTGNQITVSQNLSYTTIVTATSSVTNGVRFSTTTNMVTGEQVIISGGTIGNLVTGTYYVYQILDSNYAVISTTSPTSSTGMIAMIQATATGSMAATVGQQVSVTTSTGFLACTIIAPPTFTYTIPSTTCTFTGAISGSIMTVSNIASGLLGAGQGIVGTGIPTSTNIIIQLTPTGATALGSSTLSTPTSAGGVVLNVSNANNIVVGQIVTGTGVPNSTFVTNVSGTAITLSQALTSTSSGTYSFYTAYGQGTYTVSTGGNSITSTSLTSVSGQSTITVNTTAPHGFTPGETINVIISTESGYNNNSLANGPFFVESVTGINTFTYTARGAGVITGTLLGTVYARPDSFYSHRPFDGGVQLGTGLSSYAAQAIRMSKKYIRYQSGKSINFNTGLLMAPNYFVRSVTSQATAYTTGLSITNITTSGVATITSGTYIQGQAIVVSNVALNGALGFTAGTYYVANVGGLTTITLASSILNASNGVAITTVTTSGGLISSVVAAPIITLVTDDVDHGCQPGAIVTVNGVVTPGYNGTYTVAGILDERTIQVAAIAPLGASSAITGATVTDPCLLSINNWYGAAVRSGTFDDQNGVFFQYDGSVVSVVKRASTFQLAGTISLVVGSGQVIGANTRFTAQIFVGDRVVIRGMTHMVTQIISDTLMYVNPQYRGFANVGGIKFTKTIDYVVPQSKWNLDRCDGSNSPYNPSGYFLNPIKMQMVAMQWTWYGAGFIDWMLRGPEGKYITVHRLRNNNLNNEAWMRTGNMPVRYEVTNEGARSYIVGSTNVSTTDTVIPINDASFFPTPVLGNNCTIYVDNELINYTGKINTYAISTSAAGNTVTVGSTVGMTVGQPIVFTNNITYTTLGNIANNTTYYVNTVLSSTTITLATILGNIGITVMPQVNATLSINNPLGVNALTGCTRSVGISPWATGGYRIFTAGSASTHTVQTGVILVNGSASPVVSHWGAAFIEDGGFDSDRSYIFNYQITNVPITTKKNTAFAIRLAPSVSNAIPGDLGSRELINRASFLLQSLESSSGAGGTNAAIVVEGVINPSNYPATTNIQFNSMSSAVNPTGQPSFSQVAPGSSTVFANSANNYVTCPTYVQAGTTAIPTIGNPGTAGVLVGDDVYFPTSTGSLYGLTKVAAIASNSAALTASIAQGGTASFTANFAGNVMTVTAVASGTITIGMLLSGTSLGSGTYITNNVTGTGSGVGTWGVSVTQTIGNVTVSGTATIMTVSAISSGIISTGGLLAGGTVQANTYIIAPGTGLGGTGTYYLNTSQSGTTATTLIYNGITLNQATLSPVTLFGGTGTTVQVSRNTYALPGETVFSYINSPANKDALDLSNLKELTNTPIGGRGCYPNGCDTMFVNVYITQGSPISTNLVLRWGEAQA